MNDEVVKRLMNAANEGMDKVCAGATSEEVISAYLTLARQAIIVARTWGVSPEILHGAVSLLWLECVSVENMEQPL